MQTHPLLDASVILSIVYIFGAALYGAWLQIKYNKVALTLLGHRNNTGKKIRYLTISIALVAIYVAGVVHFYYSRLESS